MGNVISINIKQERRQAYLSSQQKHINAQAARIRDLRISKEQLLTANKQRVVEKK